MKNTMFNLFGYALREGSEKEKIDLDRAAWESIYKLSKKHDLSHLIGYALKGFEISMDEDLQNAFDMAMNMAAFRYIKISHELEEISRVLENAQICFMPLKGSVLRKYYKEPWLRTCCDIDLLVSKQNLEAVKEIFVNELNYYCDSAWNYEISFYTPAKIHIELHHTLQDEAEDANKVLSTVWENSAPSSDCPYRYEMCDEMFYLYHMAHMAKHFVNGGCGIRSFLDIWVLNHACSFDKQKRYALLEKANLLAFAKAAEELSEAWIENKPHSSLTEQLERFVFTGGSYGTVENRVAVQQAMTGGRFSYLLSRIFLPYNQLKLTYPNLEKRKWLFPFYQVKRWFRLFYRGRLKKSVQEAKTTSAVTGEKNDQITSLLETLGIK